MRNVGLKRMPCLLLTLLLVLCLTASACADILSLDRLLTNWLTIDNVRFAASLEAHTLLPFTPERLEKLNGLLKHTTLQVALEWDEDSSFTSLQLAVDDSPLFSLSEREQGQGSEMTTSLLPNRILQSTSDSPIDLLGGTAPAQEPSFDMLAAIQEAGSSYQALIDACEPYAESKKASYKIKNVGNAKWSQIARLATEESDTMLPLLRAVLGSGMDEAYRAELSGVRFGKGFIVGLYKQAKDGKDIAVYMKGDLLYPDGTKHRLSYQWAFLDKGNERVDTYKYEAVKDGKPADSRIANGEINQKKFTDSLSLKGNSRLLLKGDGVNTETTQKIDLSGKASGTKTTLEGMVSTQEKTTQTKEETSTTLLTTLTPALAFTPLEEGGGMLMSGTLALENKADKTLTSAYTLTFVQDAPPLLEALSQQDGLYAVREEAPSEEESELPPSSIAQNIEEAPDWMAKEEEDFLVGTSPIGLVAYTVPNQSTTLQLDQLRDAELEALLDEMAQSLAGRLLVAYGALPGEDAAFLQEGMTDEDFAAFLSLLEGL